MGFRYHITTLASIFLALGLGVIIGSSFVQSKIVDRQTKLLSDLRTQFETKVVPVQDRNRNYGAFVRELPRVLRGTALFGSRVALIQTGDYPDTVRAIRETLEESGLLVTSVTTIDRTFPAR